MPAVLETVLKEIQLLSLNEKKYVRDKMNEMLSENESPEMLLQNSLYDDGLLSEVKPPRTSDNQHNFSFVTIEGKPLSETIIEERR
jgi:hypothetical protein